VPKNPCERKCWACGNVAMHTDDVAPDVCCQKCGSQDTRLTKPSPAMQKITDREEFEQIGQLLARCEEYSIMQHEDCKSASVRLNGQKRFSMGRGTTQLDAIRNAIEAAEQGVASSTNEPN